MMALAPLTELVGANEKAMPPPKVLALVLLPSRMNERCWFWAVLTEVTTTAEDEAPVVPLLMIVAELD